MNSVATLLYVTLSVIYGWLLLKLGVVGDWVWKRDATLC